MSKKGNRGPGDDEPTGPEYAWLGHAGHLFADFQLALEDDAADYLLDDEWHEEMAEVIAKAPDVTSFFMLRQVADHAPPPPPATLWLLPPEAR